MQANNSRNNSSQLTCSLTARGTGTGARGACEHAICNVRVLLVIEVCPCCSVCACPLGSRMPSGARSMEGAGPSFSSTDGATPGTSAHLATSSQATAAQPWPRVCLDFKQLGVSAFKTNCCQPTGQLRNLQILTFSAETAPR